MSSARMGQIGVFEVGKLDLQSLTNNFSRENFICEAQFCNLYHGKIPHGWNGLEGRDVTVKVWVKQLAEKGTILAYYKSLVENFNFEIGFLRSDKATSCSYLPRLITHCRDGENDEFLGVVYDLQSSDTLRNFVDKAEFKWLERIKVAVGLARLLKLLHCDEPRHLVRDLSAAHIILDKDWNPVLFNYFMLDAITSVEQDTRITRGNYGSYGYIDTSYVLTGLRREYSDVFAFGVILCELLFKRKVDSKVISFGGGRFAYQYIYFEARKLYPVEKSKIFFQKEKKYSFVDKSFEEDPDFNVLDAPKISKLARLCVEEEGKARPNIKEVVRVLEKLNVVRDHAEMFTA